MQDRTGGTYGNEDDGGITTAQEDQNAHRSHEIERRREALSRNLQRLGETHRSGEDLRTVLKGIELTEWELQQLARGLDNHAESWQSLIVEGVALRAKVVVDSGWSAASEDLDPEGDADPKELSITNAAIGIALVRETQLAVSQLLLAGEIDEAKKLTDFRNKIGQCIQDLKENVGDDAYTVAKNMSGEFTRPANHAARSVTSPKTKTPRERTSGSSWSEEDEKKLTELTENMTELERRAAFARAMAEAASRPAPVATAATRRPAQSKNVKTLLMVLGVVVCVWLVFVLPRIASKPLPVLDLQDVTPRAEIRHVVARPPSLFVEVDGERWSAMSINDRRAVIEDVGRTAAAAGYNGVNFTNENGRSVAQWFRQRGIEMAE